MRQATKNYRKHAKKVFMEFAKIHGFHWVKNRLVRESNDVVQFVCFDLTSTSMRPVVAVLPLYVPQELMHITFSRYLHTFRHGQVGQWALYNLAPPNLDLIDVPEQDIIRDLQEMKDLVEEFGLPWFEHVGNPTGFLEWLSPHSLHWTWYTSLGYLHLGRVDEARKILSEYNEECLKDSDFPNEKRHMCAFLVHLIDHSPEQIPVFIDECVRYSRANLGLENVSTTTEYQLIEQARHYDSERDACTYWGHWTRETVLRALSEELQNNPKASLDEVCMQHPTMYHAANLFFGGWNEAKRSAKQLLHTKP